MLMEISAASAGLKLVAKGALEKLKQFQEERTLVACELLLAELKSGKREAQFSLEENKNLYILSRYIRAAQEGAANKNLRLMAQIIRGTVEAGDINPDRCNYLQNIVAEMSEEEIRLVWLLYEEKEKKLDKAANYTLAEQIVPTPYPTKAHFDAALTRLLRTGLINQLNLAGSTGYQTSPLFDELLELVNLQTFDFVN